MVSPKVAYEVAGWENFFLAVATAAAALTGLLFVSLSINLQQIVKSPMLTARAGKALATLTAVLLMGSLCLIPGQDSLALGLEIGISALVVWIVLSILHHRAAHNNPFISRGSRHAHFVLVQASVVPMIVAAISLVLHRGGGLYWLAAATLLSVLSALMDAWVLLIEIQR